jgi:uncharacterized protein (TIGR03435 family)
MTTAPIPTSRSRSFRVIALTGLALSAASPQDPAWNFEAADVHLDARTDATEVTGGLTQGGRYLLRHATMLDLVRIAYDVDANQVLGGPTWLALDRFEIKARVPAGTAVTAAHPMLRALLAERFGLLAHRDTKPVQAWTLTAGNHPLLRPSDGSRESGCSSQTSDDVVNLACRNITMADFVANLRSGDGGVWYYLTDNLVVDRTGLAGAWDFDLKYSARWNTSVAGAKIVSLFDAIDRPGLKPDPSMVPMPVVVVDRVNRTPTPNSPEADKAFPPPPTEFEVADVKRNSPDYYGSEGFQWRGGGLVEVRGVTLNRLIATAWGVTEETIVDAPRFMDSDHWNIVAKAPKVVATIAAAGDGDLDALRPMLKTLLRSRRSSRGPPKLKPADPDSRTGCREGLATLTKVDPRSVNPTAARLLTCTNVSMPWLASHLRFLAGGYVHNDVLDETGLEGGWDFTLSFSKARQLQANTPGAGEPPDPNGALSVQEAMEKQLGLKLVTRKRPVPVLVIDHIESRPAENE